MRQPMSQIYTSISDIYKFEDVIFVSYDGLDMVPGQFVWTQGRRIVALFNCVD